MSPLAERLQDAAARIELDSSDLARVLDTRPRNVARWFRQETEPRAEARERLLEVLAVLERLSETLKPQAARDWLFAPNPMLEYYKPVELLRDGQFRRVLAALDALAEGVFV